MKRTLVSLAIFLSVCICFAQNGYNERIVKRIENKLYIVEDGIQYKVDETRVIAKLKPQREFPRTLCKETQNLGFEMFEIPVPDGMKVENFLSLIERTDYFEFVDYNTYGKYLFTPNDSLIGNAAGCQWYLANINAYEAWNITKGNSTIKVAVLDSGVDSCHYDLHYGIDNYTHLDILNGYNYPNNTNYSAPTFYHGTMVAGILGAKTNNNRGIAGVSGGNYSAGITIIPFCVGNYEPSTNYIINAISKAVEKGAKIINMSFSLAYNDGVANAINSAYNQGISIICATGNNNSSFIKFPASHSNTIAVGATNQSNLKADFSNYGNGIDLVAPGVDIKSTYLGNSYYSDSGTSFAAPQVAGVVALMLSVNPTLTPSQITSTLQNTCTKLSSYSYSNGWNSFVGYGLLNAYDAVYAVAPHKIVGPPLICTNGTYSIENLPSGVTVEWSLSNSYYNQNCLQQNYPSTNQCTITRSSNQDMMNATLTANIKYNGVTFQTFTKTVYAYSDFYGQYTSDNLSGTINYTHTFNVKPGYTTVVSSPNFEGGTASYDNTGTTPSYFYLDPTISKLYFTMPTNNNGYPVVINVNDGCGNYYQLYAIPQNYLYLEISNVDGEITVTLHEKGEDSSKSVVTNQPWTIEICNASSGVVMATQSSTSRSVSISTSTWPKGLYIVKATVGKEELTEKVIVK